MDAKLLKVCAFYTLVLTSSIACGATFTTANFVVTAPTEEVARKVANCAEFWRRDLAIQWLGQPLPNWYKPCPISVRVGQLGAGGQTTFTFENGEVFGWKMQVQGTLERILDSVIPHEVNHTIFASHFRRPVPRWADEGAATLFEHDVEKARQIKLLEQVIQTNRRIPLKDLLMIKEYPTDMQDVLTLYAEGYSLAEYLVGSKGEQGRKVYLQFLTDAHHHGWSNAIQRHYGYASIEALEKEWHGWVLAGSPSLNLPAGQQLAQASAQTNSTSRVEQTELTDAPRAESATVVRGQDAPLSVEHQENVLQPLAAVSRPLRTVHSAANVQEGQHISDSATDYLPIQQNAEQFRTRTGDQLRPSSSPPPASLTPTADGIRANPDGKHFEFPSARKAFKPDWTLLLAP